MRTYIIRRLLLTIPTVFLASIIIFFTIRLIPGDVVEAMAEDKEFITGTGIEAIRRELGLDVPIPIQYARWVSGILRGDLGDSLWTRRPVIEELLPRLPVSFELGLLAIVVGLIIALPVGIFAAIRQDAVGDYIARSAAIACIALPAFWLATLIMVLPPIWWGWSPSMEYIPFFENPLGNLGMFIIPATIMGMHMSGTIMRMTRTMMLEVLRQDYIRTAWSKGLKERVIVTRHALKNALIPVVTIVGLRLPVLIAGSIIVEKIFNLPGIGRLLIEVIKDRDYPILSGINLIMVSLILLANLVVDLTYAYLDPRVHYR